MKILHLVASLNTGGAEKQLAMLCEGSFSGFEHSVLCLTTHGEWTDRLRAAGSQVSALGATSMKSPAVPIRLRKVLRNSDAAVIHCWLPSVNLLGALVNHSIAGQRPPIIASVRNVDNWKPFWYRQLERWVSPLWSAVICNSQAGLAAASNSGISREKLHYVANGITHQSPATVAERLGAREIFGIDEGALVVATVCRLTRQKRVDLFLNAAHVIRRAEPNARFLIAGDGPLRKQLEKQAADFGDSVIFTGRLENSRTVLAASDFFILCSDREGTSNALLEAMQAGCVPVVTDAGDNHRIIQNGESGIVTQPDRIAQELLQAHRDNSLCERYRSAAIRAAFEYTPARMIEKTLEIYKEVTEARASDLGFAIL